MQHPDWQCLQLSFVTEEFWGRFLAVFFKSPTCMGHPIALASARGDGSRAHGILSIVLYFENPSHLETTILLVGELHFVLQCDGKETSHKND